MTNLPGSILLLSLLALPAELAAAWQTGYPPAPRGDVVDTLHGVPVPDPYRWMEDMGAPEVVAHVRAQDEVARRYVATKERGALRKQVGEIARVERYAAPLKRGDRHFYLRFPASGPGTSPETAVLLRETERGPALVVIDPAALPEGAALAWAIPDPAGRRVAYLVTRDGSSWGTLRIREIGSGRDLSDRLIGIRAGTSGLAWSPDGAGFFYQRFDLPKAGNERSGRIEGERIAFHAVGDPQERDAVVFQSPDLAGWSLSHLVTADGRYLVIVATDGATQHTRVHYRDLEARKSPVVTLIGESDAAYRFVGNRGGIFWIWTDRDAPRGRIVAIDLERSEPPRWVELVPEAEETISSWIGATRYSLPVRSAVPHLQERLGR
jgi:prolyl oligopeptidase